MFCVKSLHSRAARALWLGGLCFGTMIGSATALIGAAPDAPAKIVITDNIVAPSPKPFGLNQLNGRWGLNNIGYDDPTTGFEPQLVRDRWFVSTYGSTGDGRAWFEDNAFKGENLGDGYWDGATIRVYRPTVQSDGVTTYQRVLLSSVQKSYIDRGFWVVSFGLNDSLNTTVTRPNGQTQTVSFRNVLPASARSYADGQVHQFYQMTDLKDGATYYYTVQAIDSGGNWSSNSAVASAVPGDAHRTGPRIVTHQIGPISVGDTNKNFTINVTNGVGSLTFFIVGSLPGNLVGEPITSAERQAYRIRQPSGVPATSTEAATSTIRLRVEDANGAWDERDIILNPKPPTLVGSDTTPPSPPTNVQAVAMDGAVYVTWDASPSSDVVGYRVLRSRFAPSEQLGRIELAHPFSFQVGDLVFADKEFSRISGHPEYYHERLHFSAFEGDALWPQWKINGTGGWLDWRNSYNNGYHADFNLDCVAPPTPIPTEFKNVGTQVLRVQVPATWQLKLMLGKVDYTNGADNLYYRALEPGKTYHMKAWVRQTGLENGQVAIEVSGNTYGSSLRRTFTIPSSQWTQIHISDWTIPAYDQVTSVDRIDLIATAGSGTGTLWLDHVEIYEFIDEDEDGINDTPFGEMTEFWKNEMKEFFELANPNEEKPMLRYWGLQSNGKGGVALDDMLNPLLAQRKSGGGGGDSLPIFLKTCHEVGANPWLILSVSMQEEEWANMLEYLAGGSGTTYGAKRIADRGGITTPWTSEFDRIIIEVDNETWNSMFAWTFYGAPAGQSGGVAYGRYAEMLIRAMKNSALWQSNPSAFDAKIDFVVNGFNGGQTYGKDAAIAAPSAEIVDLAPYLGGWESGAYIGGTTLTDEGFQDWMLYAPWKHYGQVNGHLARLQEASLLRPTPYRLGVYEGGPGYDLPGPSNPSGIVPESYGKSLAAAVTTLDSYLYESYRGYDAQAFFGFGVGSRWTTHAFRHVSTTQPLQFLPQATWLAQKLRNNFASGSMVETFAESVPTIDLPAEAGQPAATNTPLVATYAFKDGNRYSVLLLSRKIDERDSNGDVVNPAITPVELILPFTSAQSISVHRLASDPRATNVPSLPYYDPNNMLEIESYPLDANLLVDGRFVVGPDSGGVVNDDGTILGLPPGSIYLYVFEGTQAPSKPSQPQATIARGPGQQLSSFETTARFRVSFDRPITGFTVGDLDFSASTANLSSATITINPLDPLISTPLAYEVVVSGVTSGGIVSFNLPAGVVNAVSGGAGNSAASGADAAVRLISSTRVIDFDSSRPGVPELGTDYRVDAQRARSYTTMEEDAWITLDLNTPIYPNVGEQPVYGGIRAKALTGTNGSGQNVMPFIMLANAEGQTVFPNSTFTGFITNGGNSGVAIDIGSWAVFLWKKSDFIGINQSQPLQLNAGSRLSLTIDQWLGSDRRFHFIIKDGSTYYISEASYSGDASFTLTEFVSNPSNRWAPIGFTEGTHDFSVKLDDLGSLSFAARSFNDVVAAGFAARVRSGFYRIRGFKTFGMDLVTDTNPYLATELTASQTIVTGDKVLLSVSAIDADTATLSYTWQVVSKPNNAAPSLAVGPTVNLAAGAVATNTVTFDKSGQYVFRVSISDGTTTIQSNTVTVNVDGDFVKDGNTPTITTTSLPNAMEGTFYSTTLSATGGDGALTWSITGAPTWLSINPTTGVLSGTPPAAASESLTVWVADEDNDKDNKVFSITVQADSSGGGTGGLEVLVESDFTGTNLAQNTPWTATSEKASWIDFSGWVLGSGAYPEPSTNVLAYYPNAPAAEEDSTLQLALSDNEYLSATIEATSGSLNLRNALMEFTIQRISYHSPRYYAVLTSVEGFTANAAIFDTGRFTGTALMPFSFNFPDTSAYENITGPVEIRIVGYGGQFLGHETSLAAFKLSAYTDEALVIDGLVNRDYWTGIGGTLVSNLTNASAYPASPTGSDVIAGGLQAIGWVGSDAQGATLNWGTNYGQKLYGYIVPEVSGNYTFWISGDDYCEFWLSSSSSPSGLVKTAWVYGWCAQHNYSSVNSDTGSQQKSSPVALQAGEPYYFEVLHKEGSGGDHVSVAWSTNASITPTSANIVPASVLTSSLTSAPAPQGGVLVESDFTGTNLAQNTPWTATSEKASWVDFSGWVLGSGAYPEPSTNVLAYYPNSPAAEEDSTLQLAISDNEYISATIEATSGSLNLRNALMEFTMHRISYHAPRYYAVFTSVEGFTASAAIYDTGRFTATTPTQFSFNFPDTSAYENITGPVEIRIVGYGGQFLGHETGLAAFKITAN